MTDYSLGHGADEQDRLQRQAGYLRGITESIWRSAGLAPGMRVLDVGCGVGDTSFLAADLVGAEGVVVGQDRSPAAIAAAQQRNRHANVEFVQGELGSLPDGHAPFDAIVGRYVLIHQPDVSAALRSLLPLLKAGGLLAFHELELDVRTVSEPACPLAIQVRGWIGMAFHLSGTQLRGVSQLPRHFYEAGLGWPRVQLHPLVASGPDSFAPHYLVQTLRTLAPVLIDAGVVSLADLGLDTLEARLRAACANGAATLAQINGGAWARCGLSATPSRPAAYTAA